MFVDDVAEWLTDSCGPIYATPIAPRLSCGKSNRLIWYFYFSQDPGEEASSRS